MKILLVSPPTKLIERIGSYRKRRVFAQTGFPPLGLAYIAAVLEENGYKGQVEIEDMCFYSTEEEVEKTLREKKPDILGVSCFTDFRITALKVIKIAKKINPNIITLMGGSHATSMYEQILLNYPVDFIILGEGEYTTLELVKTLESNGDVRKVKGIAYRDNDKIVKTEPRPFIENLDELPFPARHLLNLDMYTMDLGTYFYNLNKSNWLNGKKVTELKTTNLITSRGCPYNCIFCSSSRFWGRRWRFRSPKNVVDEIEYLYKKYNIEYFDLAADDNFTADRKRVREICKEIIRRKLKIRWTCSSRADWNDLKTLKLMRKAGCIGIGCGVESGSPKILKNLQKGLTPEKIIKTFDLFRKAKIDSTMALISGSPGESEETIRQTIKIIDRCKPTTLGVSVMRALPDTKLCEMAEKQGLVKDEDWLNENFPAPIYVEGQKTVRDVIRWKRKITLHFYLKVFGIKNMIKFVLINPEILFQGLKYLIHRMQGAFM